MNVWTYIWTVDELLNGRKILAVFSQLRQLRKESLKKIQAWTGIEPMTSAMPVQCSTNWAKPTGSWSYCEFVRKPETDIVPATCAVLCSLRYPIWSPSAKWLFSRPNFSFRTAMIFHLCNLSSSVHFHCNTYYVILWDKPEIFYLVFGSVLMQGEIGGRKYVRPCGICIHLLPLFAIYPMMEVA